MVDLARLARVGREQHGLVHRSQAVACGLAPSTVQRWVAGGRLERVHRSVYRLAGAPASWEQRLLAAVLASGPGAVASHRAAAALWALHDADAIEVTVAAARVRVVAGAVVHRSRDLRTWDVVRRHGVPVTNPLRTLVDLGAVVPRSEVEDALDRALTRRLVTVDGAERALHDVARRGRDGAGVMRTVLEERALGRACPDGLLEPRMARLLRDAGLPAPAFQHHVRVGGRFVARVDFAYPEARLALEVDGHESHASPRALQSDLERQNRLVAVGWTVLRFTWADVVGDRSSVARTVGAVLRKLVPAERA